MTYLSAGGVRWKCCSTREDQLTSPSSSPSSVMVLVLVRQCRCMRHILKKGYFTGHNILILKHSHFAWSNNDVYCSLAVSFACESMAFLLQRSKKQKKGHLVTVIIQISHFLSCDVLPENARYAIWAEQAQKSSLYRVMWWWQAVCVCKVITTHLDSNASYFQKVTIYFFY